MSTARIERNRSSEIVKNHPLIRATELIVEEFTPAPSNSYVEYLGVNLFPGICPNAIKNSPCKEYCATDRLYESDQCVKGRFP